MSHGTGRSVARTRLRPSSLRRKRWMSTDNAIRYSRRRAPNPRFFSSALLSVKTAVGFPSSGLLRDTTLATICTCLIYLNHRLERQGHAGGARRTPERRIPPLVLGRSMRGRNGAYRRGRNTAGAIGGGLPPAGIRLRVRTQPRNLTAAPASDPSAMPCTTPTD